MDAIKGVENEVDKVLRLFSDCKDTTNSKIDQLIELVNMTKQDIDHLKDNPEQTELSSQQVNTIRNTCDTIKKTCTQITNSHRELHVPVSKIGKSIDKNFNADFACASDPSLSFQAPEYDKMLNLAIIQHLLRYGLTNVAEALVKESDLYIKQEELGKYDELDAILTAFKRGDTGPILNWAIQNREELREINSPLEFKIHRLRIIELYKQGIDKQFEIIQYVKEAREQIDPMFEQDITPLLGGILYLQTGLENSPYKSLLDPINYKEIEEIFVSNACSLLHVNIISPIAVAVDAGCIALPALVDINQVLTAQRVQNVWKLRDELPIEINLGRKLQFHSTFSCPILKQQSTEANPPMRLVCGHVISRDALHKLSGNNNTNKLKCPYCPLEQVVSDAMQIHF